MIEASTNLRQALKIVADRLAGVGIEEPALEARHLLMAALDCSLSHLVLKQEQALGPSADRVNAFLVRRAAREPVSRILGQREFHGLDLTLGPQTLDPRPDTEVLVDAVLAALKGEATPHLLDLGTGTGAILLAMLHAMPGATGVGVDISAEAAGVAAQNAARLGLGPSARFLVGDLFAPLAPQSRFQAILSNPPYIPSADLAALDPEVRLFDPPRALDGGADGLDFYRRITAQARDYLTPGGWLAFEVGQGQAGDVAALLTATGFQAPRTHDDLAGIARVVLAQAPSAR